MGKTQVKQYLTGIWGQILPLLSWISSGSYHFDTPTVVYLINPIGSKIFKLNKFGNNLDVKAFLDNNSTVPCESTGCSFVDKYHHHVMTGNLKIITNDKLRKFFSKAPKYQKIVLLIREKLRKA